MKLLPFPVFILLSFYTFSQTVSNVKFVQKGDQVKITYDLSKEMNITLVLSVDSGKTFHDPNKIHCLGDVGKKTAPGKDKTILYNIKADNDRPLTKQDIFRVRAIESFTKNIKGLNFEMVIVKSGEFVMGSHKKEKYRSSDEIQHAVNVNDFSICNIEVSHAQYIRFMNDISASSNGCYNGFEYVDMDDTECAVAYKDGKFYFKANYFIENENYPMVEVTWAGAVSFAKWIGGRLPTEAEWEYAARGGAFSNGYKYSGGDKAREVAIFKGSSKRKNRPSSTKKPNELGLFDMCGSVWEWCSDWYEPYNESNQSDPRGASKGKFRVIRGGSWNSYAEDCRSAYRGNRNPKSSGIDCGFRIVYDK